ncbi:MAG: hypothetical protein HY719_14725 [Planctomycetes bacterium]|nr:hypothetical protein [Planctomycetota bacterium]
MRPTIRTLVLTRGAPTLVAVAVAVAVVMAIPGHAHAGEAVAGAADEAAAAEIAKERTRLVPPFRCEVHTEFAPGAGGLPAGVVTALERDAAGALVAYTESGAARLSDGDRFVTVAEAPGRMPAAPPRDAAAIAGFTPDPAVAEEVARVLKEEATCAAGNPRDRDEAIIGTADGLRCFDGEKRLFIGGKDYAPPAEEWREMPWRETTCVAYGPDAVFIGSTRGLMRVRFGQGRGIRWDYYAGRRWLPDDLVTALLVEPDHTVWVGTKAGVARIAWPEMTLADKARAWESATRARHVRDGLINRCVFETPGVTAKSAKMWEDNDGLWTSLYVAAEALRYGATKELEAKRFADESFAALERLVAITSHPGFPARSFMRAGEFTVEEDRWPFTPDRQWRWRNDTSSDELCGHFFAVACWHDHCALTDEEKARARRHAGAIMNRIIAGGWRLLDENGQPTSWGRWDPEYFAGPGRAERGLNSLEILSFLKTTFHVTGEAKYQRAYEHLYVDEKYGTFLRTLRSVLLPRFINHSDDELAFLSYYPIMLYEQDPRFRPNLEHSLNKSFETERREKSPLWNFIYGAGMPAATDFGQGDAVEFLQEAPLDLIDWDGLNSHRLDFRRRFTDRFGSKQGERVVPVKERRAMRWNSNPYVLDSHGDAGVSGLCEYDGAMYLLPYWMGRAHGFIRENTK